jgi:UDP-glucose 4-epimerase
MVLDDDLAAAAAAALVSSSSSSLEDRANLGFGTGTRRDVIGTTRKETKVLLSAQLKL